MARFLTGVNYWPRSSGTAMWANFDLTEVEEDFARIAALGLDVVRVFLTWEVFSSAPDTIAQEPLVDFVALLDAAHARALRVIPVLFFGHASRTNWIPAWALDRERRSETLTLVGNGLSPWSAGDIYTGELLEAQRGLARTLGTRAREHAAILAWDIGNAFTAVREPRTQDEVAHWNAALTHDLFETSNLGTTASLRPHDVLGETTLDLAPLAEAWKFVSLGMSRSLRGPGEFDDLVRALHAVHRSARRPAFVTSLGLANGSAIGMTDTHHAAEFASAALDRLQREGALGALWWRFSDDLPERRALPPLDDFPDESACGLIGCDGREKPVARALATFAAERRPLHAPQGHER